MRENHIKALGPVRDWIQTSVLALSGFDLTTVDDNDFLAQQAQGLLDELGAQGMTTALTDAFSDQKIAGHSAAVFG